MVKKLSIADKVLQAKKDLGFQRDLQSEQLDFEGRAEHEISTALMNSTLQKAASQKRKRYLKFAGIGFGLLLALWAYNWLFSLPVAGMSYGVCKVFLEQNVQYPHTLQYSQVEFPSALSVRIWYAQTNAFGEYRMDNIRCNYEINPEKGMQLQNIIFRSGFFERRIPPAELAAYNQMIPVITSNPPDLTYPRPLPDRLKDLRIETHLFRRPIF